MRKPAELLLPFLFLCIVVGGGLSILKASTGAWWPSQASLINWDAGWYSTIVKNGYQFDAHAANNTAFFPLFPYLWKALHLSPATISVVNALLFLSGCYVLFKNFPGGTRLRIIYLALTLMVFYTTPMSEGLFFLFSSLLLTGLERNKPSLTIAGLIGCGLCRSVSSIFFPAFLVMALFSRMEQRQRTSTLRYLLFGALSLSVLLTVFSIHWYQTGEFMAFYKTQRFWYARFQLPDIPFNTWKPEDNGYVDQFAALLAFLSIVYLIYHFVLLIRRKAEKISPAHLFALLYMGGTALLMLFTHGCGFNSINRYILATPFLYLFLKHVQVFRFTTGRTLFILVFGVIYYLVGWHMGVSLYRVLIFVSVLAGMCGMVFLLKKDKPYINLLTALFVLAALYVQAVFWSRFVMNTWVG